MGPFHHRQKKTESYGTQNEAVSSQQNMNSSLTQSTSIILGSRLFKARGYNLRFISEPLYRFYMVYYL